jgi:LysM repeat protein
MSSFDPRPPPSPEPPRHGQRSPVRFLPPFALIGVIVVLVVIISGVHNTPTTTSTVNPFALQPTRHPAAHHSVTRPRSRTSPTSTSGGAGLTSTTTPGAATDTAGTGTSTTSTSTTETGTTTSGTYTIASGDTFAAVSATTGVPLRTIEKLNPGVSSSALTVGQVIKLK